MIKLEFYGSAVDRSRCVGYPVAIVALWVLNPIQSSSHVFSLTNSTGNKKSSFSYNLSPDTATNLSIDLISLFDSG